MNALVRDVLQTRELRQLLIAIVTEFLNIWAGSSGWKKTLSRLAGSMVSHPLSCPEEVPGKNEIAALFENEAFIKNVNKQLPDIINGLLDALCAGTRKIVSFSNEDKIKLFEDLLSSTGKGRTGGLLTDCARILNDLHRADPEFLARILEPGVIRWLESMDFGELKEAVDNFGQGFQALVAMINTVIWQYPSKVIGILSLLPSAVNLAAGATVISVEKLNAVAPDLLTDILIALLKEIDGKAVAGVVDQLSEIGRKLHTGSALLGEPGSPQLPKALSEVIDKIVARTDAVTFWKGRIAFAEIKASFDAALANAADQHPEYARLSLMRGPELFNIRMRSKNKQLSLLESRDDEVLTNAMAEHLSIYDVQEAAEGFNTFLRLTNRLWEKKPGVCTEFVTQFVNAVDGDELAHAVRHLFGDMRKELRPAARSVVPGLVEWVCDVLQPEDDENEDDATRARKALRSLMTAEEAS
ncbi:MAG: hypothetical protein V1844_22880 [Pseudomonadota bacterium]